jgi:hypothetical protein
LLDIFLGWFQCMSVPTGAGSVATLARSVPAGGAEVVAPAALTSIGRMGQAVQPTLEPPWSEPPSRYQLQYHPPLESVVSCNVARSD